MSGDRKHGHTRDEAIEFIAGETGVDRKTASRFLQSKEEQGSVAFRRELSYFEMIELMRRAAAKLSPWNNVSLYPPNLLKSIALKNEFLLKSPMNSQFLLAKQAGEPTISDVELKQLATEAVVRLESRSDISGNSCDKAKPAKRRRGPKPIQRESVKAKMRDFVRRNCVSVLAGLKQEALVAEFSAGVGTCLQARKEVLSEFQHHYQSFRSEN